MDMKGVYAVMSKGKWARQQPLDIQHGLVATNKKTESKTLDQAIQGVVKKDIEKWQKKTGVANQQKRESRGDSNLTTQMTGTVIIPELLVVLLQGTSMKPR